tara:strand:- start:91850 stop:92293 length:444 start_codon:yes stop_codon:yes gene_type:complete
MAHFNFTSWIKFEERNNLSISKIPGVYLICISDQEIAGNPFDWMSEICYIGMSVSNGGLKSRLDTCRRAIINGKSKHSGGKKIQKAYPNYEELKSKLYLSVQKFDINPEPKKTNADTLRQLGEVVKHEYICLAKYLDKFGQYPRFNS